MESERKRLVEMQQVITAEQAMTFLGAVVAAIRRYVTDRDTLAASWIGFSVIFTPS